MKDKFQEGINDFNQGICKLPNTMSFFGLKTEEERWYWHGWFFARDSKNHV